VRWNYNFLRHLSFEWDSGYLVSSQTNVLPRVGCAIKGSPRTSMNNCRCIIASYYSKVFRYVGFLKLCNMVSPTTIPHFLGYCAFSLLISLTFSTVSEHLDRFWIWDPPLPLCFIMFPLGKQMQADGKNKSMAAPLPQPLGVVWLALGSVMRGIQRGNWLELIEGQGFMLICSEPWVFLMVFLVTGLVLLGKSYLEKTWFLSIKLIGIFQVKCSLQSIQW